ncbi:ABC transporter permease [Pseudosporangium ferrugineum]|nr:ABC transporter permease [Pseudosporangium ferrugineum]
MNTRQFSVIFIEPLLPDAPLPPGLRSWPEPGQAVISPALLRAGAGEGIASRYGDPAGTIGPEGLEAPGEKLAYFRPPKELISTGKMYEIEGFGSLGHAPVGDGLMVRPLGTFRLLVGFLMVLPALVLLAVAARTGSQSRDRRVALVTVLGGTRFDRILVSAGESALAVSTGVAVSSILLPILATTDVRLPYVDYVISASDVRGSIWLLVAMWIAAGAASILTIVVLDLLGLARRGGTRPTGKRRAPTALAALCPVMLLVAVRGPDLFTPDNPARLLVNYAGVAGTLITLPAVVGMAAKVVGNGTARIARALRTSGLLVAGRWMSAQPNVIARVTSGIVAAVVILIQVQVWYGFLGASARAAEAVHRVVGDSIQVSKLGADASSGQIAAYHRSIENVALPLVIVSEEVARSTRIVGSCATLNHVGLPCSGNAVPLNTDHADERLRVILDLAAPARSAVTSMAGSTANVALNADSHAIELLVSPSGHPIDRAAIVRAAYRTLPGGADVSPIGGDWLIGASVNADQGRWIVLLGAFAVAVLTLACGVSGLAEYLRWSRVLAPVSVLAGNRAVFISSAAWSVFMPILLAAACAFPIGMWLALPVAQKGSGFSVTLIQAGFGCIVSLGFVLYAWAISASRHVSRNWLPSGD